MHEWMNVCQLNALSVNLGLYLLLIFLLITSFTKLKYSLKELT